MLPEAVLKKAQAEMEKMEAKEKPVSKNMFRAIWQKASGAQLRLGAFFIYKKTARFCMYIVLIIIISKEAEMPAVIAHGSNGI